MLVMSILLQHTLVELDKAQLQIVVKKYSLDRSGLVLLITLCAIGFSVNAEESINRSLLQGEWRLTEIYYQDSNEVRKFDKALNNKLIITVSELIEVIQISSDETPRKIAHKYKLNGDCILILNPSKKMCWPVSELTNKRLVLETPIGQYRLVK